jgi:hypothetical protein
MLVTNFWLKYILYKIVRAWFQLIDVGRVHPVRVMSLRALEESADFIEAHMPEAIGFDTQKELLEFAVDSVAVAGHFLEFGVFKGGTIRRIAKRRPNQQIDGFDSFEGLPEGWFGHNLPKGTFSTGGNLPSVPTNVALHKGWFDASLPKWLSNNPGSVAFVHNDSDLYSSAVTIFDLLGPRMQPGTIVLFDEFFNYPGWKQHQVKAWTEFAAKHGVTYAFIGYARQQAALRIVSVGGNP